MNIKNIIRHITDFLIDRRCMICNAPLTSSRYCICEECENEGIFDNLRLKCEGNTLEKRLYGLTSCKAAAALMPYTDDNGARTIIHQLKYNNHRNIAIQLGEAIGKRILQSPRFGHIDWVVPVPLHPAKLRKRGYNQSELVAAAIAKYISAKVNNDNLFRTGNNESQTKHSRINRMENVRGLFDIHNIHLFQDCGVLLVDDVFTTGSTILECCKALDKTPNINLYVYTIAAGE